MVRTGKGSAYQAKYSLQGELELGGRLIECRLYPAQGWLEPLGPPRRAASSIMRVNGVTDTTDLSEGQICNQTPLIKVVFIGDNPKMVEADACQMLLGQNGP